MARAILLAEDNEDDVFFFKAAAKKAGLSEQILVASNGRDAIEFLGKLLADEPNIPELGLVLLDLKMPFVGGLEVLEWARARPELRFLPIVVLTSSEQESDMAAAYRLGASSFLVKPSQPERMSELVRLLHAYWLQHNRLPAAGLDRQRVQQAAPAA